MGRSRAGQFGASSAFYDDYRWQHQVTENMSVGRRFPTGGRTFVEIRAEFFNIFNRTNLRMPTDFNNNPLSTRTFNSRGEPTGGFGYINPTATPNGAPAERTDRREVPVLKASALRASVGAARFARR